MIDSKELIEKADLTERQVRFLIGYYFEGYFEREIAEQEGCSRPTVSVDLTKAKQKLVEAGFPEPRRMPRPSIHYFENSKLNTLFKRPAGFHSWLEKERH